MSGADARQRAAAGPTETDIAFAKALKSRRVGGDDEPAVAPDLSDSAQGGRESSEMAALKAELAQLRAIVMAKSAPTDARRIGEVADAELAAEACSAELFLALDSAKSRAERDRNGDLKRDADGEIVFQADDVAKIRELRSQLKTLNVAVDVARAKAGVIPKTHPGLKRLPPDHEAFRVR